jgi:tRNA nucleotidyltransferase (CCA-adding enzyme)
VSAPTPEQVRRALPATLASVLEAVTAEAERRGIALWLVGGPVRDLLLRRPLRDVDLLLELHGEGGAESLARAAAPPGARVVGHDRFGTVRLATAEGEIDLAAARRESYARPGALPSVEPGTVEEDLCRRDFTVNALALALDRPARRGRAALLDPGGALEDLEARTLRVFHPRSFHDDPTRALRAARLAARLGFRLARGTRSALRDALRDGAFGAVSGERFRREIEKLFSDAALGLDPAAALRLLDEWHVLGALEPGLVLPAAAAPALRRLGRALAEPPWPVGRTRPWVAGLAVWLAAVDATLRRRTLGRLAVRGEAAERIASFSKRRERGERELARARGRGAIDAVLAPIDEESLLALWSLAGPAERRRIARWASEDRTRRAPVTGADLVAAGLAGPVVGVALARIRVAFLDGAVREREAALALAREIAARETRRARRRARGAAKPRTGESGTQAQATAGSAGLGCPPEPDLP